MSVPRFDPARLDGTRITQRRLLVATLTLLLTAPAVALMADLHWRVGMDNWKILHLALFAVLFSLVAFGAKHQRQVTAAIKRARNIALLPFTAE